MWVNFDSQVGSIGGGQLEFLATKRAREMIAEGSTEAVASLPLRPVLSQCCGGIVDLTFTAVDRPETEPEYGFPMFLYGLGHVGSAVSRIMEAVPHPLVTFDDREDLGASHIDVLAVIDSAPEKAYHLVMTYSHELDFEICRRLIERNAGGSVSLIGSKSKKARFASRLRNLGLDSKRINCPVGVVEYTARSPRLLRSQ